MERTNRQESDFSRGSVSGNILRLALPMTVAQLINVLYSVIDRMYIGHIPGAACYLTMLLTIWRELVRKERQREAAIKTV